MTAKPRGSSYQVDLSYRDTLGVSQRIRFSYPTQEEARLAELRMKLAIEEGRDPRRESGRKHLPSGLAPETLEELRLYCLEYVWAGTRSEDTATSTSGRVVDELGGHIPIKGITIGTVRSLPRSLSSQGLAPATINRIVGSLGRMLTVAAEEKWIDERPKIVKVEEPAKEARFLGEDELDALFDGLEYASIEARDLAIFLLWTGCRVGEALSLEWKHVDLENHRVTFTKTKTNRNRTIPIPARARRLLSLREAASGHVFNIKQDTFGKTWNRVKKTIGMDDKGVTPHTLRHTCASRLVMSGVSLYEVAKWLGHTSIQTTQIYAHLAPDHLKGAADVLEMKYDSEEEGQV